jgi:hypothetical protein
MSDDFQAMMDAFEAAMRFAYDRGVEAGRQQAALEAEVAQQVATDPAGDLPDDPCAMR